MSRISAHGRHATEDRHAGRRWAGLRAGALALPLGLTLALAPNLVQQAAAQSNSGIYINNDVLNSLGSGPGAAPPAPLAPAAPPTPLSPRTPQAFQAPSYQAPAYQAPAPQGSGGLGFQPQGSGNFVVTRPGTLLFPPLQAPSSTLAPGFQRDNNAARSEALNNAFAGGPEPSSQLLIPLQDPMQAPLQDEGDAVIVFEDQLPAADGQEPEGERIVLRMPPSQVPPTPAPPKPAVPAQALAASQQAPATLAPEFQAPQPDTSPATAEVPAAAPAIADVEEKALAEETREAELAAAPAAASAKVPAGEADTAEADVDETPAPGPVEPASSADVAAPVAMTEPAAANAAGGGSAPVSLLPAGNAAQTETATAEPVQELSGQDASGQDAAGSAPGVQTASLSMDGGSMEGGVEDMTFLFEVDSAELSAETQAELRSLADTMRSNEGWIQVLGFASGQDSSEDQARKLALSRALKVRSFLIDAGIPSKRIQVRSMGGQVEGGPANRVDIKPVGS